MGAIPETVGKGWEVRSPLNGQTDGQEEGYLMIGVRSCKVTFAFVMPGLKGIPDVLQP